MKRILFFGDSITDMGRNREMNKSSDIWSYGSGYPIFVASSLYRDDPKGYEIINRGISGNRVVDLYARIKSDVWNLKPDVLSILIGINDIWHEIGHQNGVELDRFENVYRMLIEDTLKVLPGIKIVLCEPFVLNGEATKNTMDIPNKYERFLTVYQYAEKVKELAKDYGLHFLPLQDRFNEAACQYGVEPFLYDGVHPMVAGATLIADEWVKLFKKKIVDSL